MKIEEVNNILNDKTMQKENCNFKLTKSHPGQPPQWFRDWYSDFSDKLFARLDKIDTRLDKVENRLDNVENRLDNVENRLDKVEQTVLDQFKKHKWI